MIMVVTSKWLTLLLLHCETVYAVFQQLISSEEFPSPSFLCEGQKINKHVYYNTDKDGLFLCVCVCVCVCLLEILMWYMHL